MTAVLLTACGGGGGGGGDSSPASPASTSPTASDASIATSKNTPVNGALTASDQDGDPLTYSVVTNPALGTAVVDSATGDYIYTPDQDTEGNDSFSFKVNDGSKDSNTATVNIAIINNPPVASGISVSTNKNTPVNGNLTASDPDGDTPLIYEIATNGALGTAVVTDAATGSYTYTPNQDAEGNDSFTFTASDGATGSVPALVSVTIDPNSPPVATGSCYTTPQSTILAGKKLAASDQESMSLTYSLIDPVDGQPIGAGPVTTAKCATVQLDPATGIYTYRPDPTAGITAECSSNVKRGRDSFEFQVIDGGGLVATAIETVIIDQALMPLGDSITMGDICIGDIDSSNNCIADANGDLFNLPEDRVSFRLPLFDTLTSFGYTFDFVGSQNHGSSQMSDSNHEGHGGQSAFDLAWGRAMDGTDGVFAWLETNPADVVLLHAGTNDISNTTAVDVSDILDEIDRWETSANGNPVTVIVARIIDWSPNNPEVEVLNNDIEVMVNNRIANGDDLALVDQQTGAGFNYSIGADMSDKLHPTASGYQKMSAVWSDALVPLLEQCP